MLSIFFCIIIRMLSFVMEIAMAMSLPKKKTMAYSVKYIGSIIYMLMAQCLMINLMSFPNVKSTYGG